MKENLNKFSVSLGLLDYINPICYTVTITTIMKNILLYKPYNILLIIGAILSIVFGFVIPTGKVLVGLKVIKFKIPVAIVFLVNSGIFISGMMLLKYVFRMKLFSLIGLFLLFIVLLTLIYIKSKKMNTIAVLTGAIGYLMIYISLITISVKNNMILPIILYGTAIIIFILLCGIGIKANLKDPKVHWMIEISNVICQFLVAVGTLVIYS